MAEGSAEGIVLHNPGIDDPRGELINSLQPRLSHADGQPRSRPPAQARSPTESLWSEFRNGVLFSGFDRDTCLARVSFLRTSRPQQGGPCHYWKPVPELAGAIPLRTER